MQKRRLIRLGIIIFCLYMIVTTVRSSIDLWRAEEKLTRREEELAALTQKERELLAEKKKLGGAEYVEKVARDQLGLSKPGEQVVIIPPELLADQTPVASPDARPNWKKWWQLIF